MDGPPAEHKLKAMYRSFKTSYKYYNQCKLYRAAQKLVNLLEQYLLNFFITYWIYTQFRNEILHIQFTYSVYIFGLHIQFPYSVYIFSLHIQFTHSVYIFNLHIQFKTLNVVMPFYQLTAECKLTSVI
jgi:hypothetical protein